LINRMTNVVQCKGLICIRIASVIYHRSGRRGSFRFELHIPADHLSMVALKDLFNRFNSETVCTEEEFAATSDLRSNYVMNDGITGIENCDALLLVGTNPRYEAPVLNARIRKAFLYTDIEIGVIGGDSDLTYDYEHLGSSTKAIDDVLAGKSAFAKFLSAKNPMIIIGSACAQGEKGAEVVAKAQQLADKVRSSGKVMNVLHRWAGQVGALDVGYQAGTAAIRKKPVKFLYLLGADEGKVTRQNLDPAAFVVYQGQTTSVQYAAHCCSHLIGRCGSFRLCGVQFVASICLLRGLRSGQVALLWDTPRTSPLLVELLLQARLSYRLHG
uniref:Molybdopterin domain-containing protein n=1 Tax=Heligmosomoides polygyrus TaxID=6339 RepID=A0A183GTI9_HELPZ